MIGPVTSQHSEMQALANQFVNQTFYGALLREMRESSQGTVLDSGPGNTAFMRQLDQELVKRISERGDSPIATALCRQLGGGSKLAQGLEAQTASLEALEAARGGRWRLLMGGTGDE